MQPHITDLAARLSVVIVTHNSEDVIDDCLTSLERELPAAEVIVADNASTDTTLERASGFGAVRAVATGGNLGFGSAVNAGIRLATREFVLILNPDAPIKRVVSPTPTEFTSHESFGIRACELAPPNNPRALIGPSWRWPAELLWLFANCFLIPRELDPARPHLPGPLTRPTVTGAAFVIRRSEFWEVGGFDENFFLYFEDFDLSRAYQERSLPVATTSAIVVEHTPHTSSPRDTDRMIAFALLGLVEYAHKWDGPAAGVRAARLCTWLLRGIEAVGSALESTPVLGQRARRSARRASSVRAILRNYVSDTTFQHNRHAVSVFSTLRSIAD